MTENPKAMIQELKATYGLSDSNIKSDSNGEIAFDFEGLQVMVSQLCTGLESDEVNVRPFQENQTYFYCDSILKLKDGMTVRRTGVAMMGEPLGEESINSVYQAISIASARGYRQSLRAIGFDPIRAHRQRMSGEPFTPEPESDNTARLRKELHALATELGYIVGLDRSAYRELLRVMYAGRTSSTELTDSEILQLVTFLRASLRARQRGEELKAA